jgi:hypothetical protein
MILRSVRKATVNRHWATWAESKRFFAILDRREPPPNAVNRHAVVVGLWWVQRVPDRLRGRYSLSPNALAEVTRSLVGHRW